jgi:hypothetical protein
MKYKSVFKKFSKLDGSQHIASEFALKGIETIIRVENIKTIFEFGIGIGTIPYLIASFDKKYVYTGTESNNFCKNALFKNLEGVIDNQYFNHINDYSEYKGGKVDFLIVDGSFNDEIFLKKICHSNTIIMVEGDRSDQRDLISSTFPNSLYNFKISLYKNKDFSPFYAKENNPFVSGYSIFRLNNNFINKLKSFIDKIETSIRYKLRKII